MAGGLTVVAGGLTWIALIARVDLPCWHLVAPLLVTGCGASVAIPATMSAVMTSVPPAAIGQASGILNTLRQLGGVFGLASCPGRRQPTPATPPVAMPAQNENHAPKIETRR